MILFKIYSPNYGLYIDIFPKVLSLWKRFILYLSLTKASPLRNRSVTGGWSLLIGRLTD